MRAVLITLTPGCQNESIDCQKAKVRIAVLPIMDVKTRWNSTLELLERACRLQEFTREWLQNPKYSEYRPLFTTQDEWTIAKYVMEVLRSFRYWTLWMSKRHTVSLHHFISVQSHVRSRGWRNASFGPQEDSVERRLVPRCEVSSTEAFLILR